MFVSKQFGTKEKFDTLEHKVGGMITKQQAHFKHFCGQH